MSSAAVERTTPPAAPGPDQHEWRCACGNMLGVVSRGWLFIRHRGRIVTACLPAHVQCEACGRRVTKDA